MRSNIRRVIHAASAGKSAAGDSKRTCSTDGATIYSYAMPIARVTPHGWFVVPRGDGPSRTTRSQIDAVALFLSTHGVAVSVGPLPV
jgi:hypothetical protein